MSLQADRAALPNLSLSFIGRLRERFGVGKIRRKILGGYVLSIAIACIGATTARIVERHANERVEEQAATLRARAALLGEMDIAILELHDGQNRLLAHINNPEKLQKRLERLAIDISVVQRDLEVLEVWLLQEKQESKSGLQNHAVRVQEERLREWLPQSRAAIRAYVRQLQVIVEPLTDTNIAPDRREEGKIALADFGSSAISREVGDRTDAITDIAAAYTRAKDEIVRKAYEDVDALANAIVTIGLSTSALLGISIAVVLSSAIARPLEITNAIAKRVMEEGNFELQVPVQTKDEAGQLAHSFNQLVFQVAKTLQEIKAAQAQLVQSEKMSGLGKLAAGLAHEINNPVSFVKGNISHVSDYTNDLLELLAMYDAACPEPPAAIRDRIDEIDLPFLKEDLPKSLNSMRLGAERIHQIVLSMRAFSRTDEAGIKEMDVHEGIDSTLAILNSQLEGRIAVEKRYGCLPQICCYPVQINQVFMNLLSNAIDAVKERPQGNDRRIEIVTEVESGKNTAFPPGDRIRAIVRDTGPGIPPEVRDRIFEPFFTTKPVGSGTGLGLSISYEIVRKHGGTIVANSEPGKGTEFVVTLPVLSAGKTNALQPARS